MNNSPYRVTIHLKIFVNKEIPHIRNRSPFYFGMSIFESRG